MLGVLRRNPRFRPFAAHTTFMTIGIGVFDIFMIWAIHAQFQNLLYTSLAAAMLLFPSALSFLTGPFVDRHNKVTLIRISALLQALCVAAMLFLPSNYIWVKLAAIFVFTAISNVVTPAERAYLPRIIAGDDLIKANSLITSATVVIGLGTGVYLFRAIGDATGFPTIYTVSLIFIALGALASFFLAPDTSTPTAAGRTNIRAQIADLKFGFGYLKQGTLAPILAALVAYNIAIELVAPNFPRLIGYNLGGYGSAFLLLILSGLVGSVPGSLIASAFGSKYRLSVVVISGFALTGIFSAVFVFAMTQSLWFAMGMRFVYGAFGSAALICLDSFQQKYLPTNVLGRISTTKISFYAVAGTLGALFGGLLGNLIPSVNMLFLLRSISYVIPIAILLASKHTRSLPTLKEVQKLPDLELAA